MDFDPQTLKGAASWALIAGIATGFALLVASLFPGIIPARAKAVNL